MTSVAKIRIKRFSSIQRIFHALLMVSFLIQGATGLSRMYMQTGWGQNLGAVFGGYETARTVHIYVGIFMLIGFLVHALYLLSTVDWNRFPASLWGPDSLLPGPGDVKQFFQHIMWFFGIRKPPDFDRWGYWEKFDYWAVFWGMTIIGLTGLVLAYPLYATQMMPGWGLNLAFWIHRIEALLAMGHIFIIHFFIGHLRRHHFPMDRAIFEGSAALEAVEEEKPAWLKRLRDNGQLDHVLEPEAKIGVRIAYYVVGYAAIICGVYLLVGALANIAGVNWY